MSAKSLSIKPTDPFNTHFGMRWLSGVTFLACSMGLVLCLHDSGLAQTTNTAGDSRLLGKWEAIGVIRDGQFNEPVSYTHLTLPTIYSV